MSERSTYNEGRNKKITREMEEAEVRAEASKRNRKEIETRSKEKESLQSFEN